MPTLGRRALREPADCETQRGVNQAGIAERFAVRDRSKKTENREGALAANGSALKQGPFFWWGGFPAFLVVPWRVAGGRANEQTRRGRTLTSPTFLRGAGAPKPCSS